MELLHGPGGRALAHGTRRATERLFWWTLLALGLVGMAIFVALLGIVIWGIFTGAPQSTPG